METSGDILVGHFAYIYGLYFKPALKIFKESYNILIDKSIDKEAKKQIYGK